MSKFLRDPFLVFLLVGGLTFAFYAAVSGAEKPIIQVDAELVVGLVANQESLLGRAISRDEKTGLIENHIREEILLREAAARSLHTLDVVARTQLVEKMRFFLSEEPGEPTDADLKAYYDAHSEFYETDPKISFDHVFFEEPSTADNLLETIREVNDFSTLGKRFWLGPHLALYDRDVLTGMLGVEFIATIFTLPENEWSGPYTSKRGMHYVRVTRQMPSRLMSFDEIEHLVKQDWEAAERKHSLNARIDDLKQGYEIVVAH